MSLWPTSGAKAYSLKRLVKREAGDLTMERADPGADRAPRPRAQGGAGAVGQGEEDMIGRRDDLAGVDDLVARRSGSWSLRVTGESVLLR
jgi:hypothetical protein